MCVLVSARMELTFFIATCMVLWFGFVIETELITHQGFWLLLSSAYTS